MHIASYALVIHFGIIIITFWLLLDNINLAVWSKYMVIYLMLAMA